MTYFVSSETWAQTRFGGRNFYQQHLKKIYYKMTMEIRDFVENEAENVDIGPEISLPPEISTGPKVWKWKVWCLSFILHFQSIS